MDDSQIIKLVIDLLHHCFFFYYISRQLQKAATTSKDNMFLTSLKCASMSILVYGSQHMEGNLQSCFTGFIIKLNWLIIKCILLLVFI